MSSTVLYLTNRLYFSVCLYCKSQMTSQHVKNKKVRHETKSSGVTVVLYTLWHLLWSITVHTHTNLFALYNKNLNDLLKNLGGMKKEKQVCWRDLAWIWRHLCVSFNSLSRSTTNENAHISHVIVYFHIALSVMVA